MLLKVPVAAQGSEIQDRLGASSLICQDRNTLKSSGFAGGLLIFIQVSTATFVIPAAFCRLSKFLSFLLDSAQ